jgi:class 3 adenylate cyclase/tetratricopeptide (TPR) repeat protein
MACATPLVAAEAAEGFRKTVTILFSDVVGSTALAEQFDPETLSDVMTDYFRAMRPVIERHGGTVAKFLGDAIMAVFGLRRVHEDDALRAVKAALDMRTTLAELNSRLEERWQVTIATRTGVNTGPVAGTGLVPDQNFVAGDTANTAARLQTSAGPNEILLGRQTYGLVRHAVDVELLPPLEAKGKTAPLTVYRLLRVRPDGEAVPRRLERPLIGRASELAELESAFRRCVDDRRCGLVTLVGAPGIGKSRLTRELVHLVQTKATVFEGRCLPYGEAITYWPLAEMVRRAATVEEEDGVRETLAKVEVLAGDAGVAMRVAGLIGVAGARTPPGEGPWAVRRLFEHIAAERPLVVVFDDLQWAEAELLELVEHVAANVREAPVLIVCLARPEFLESERDWPEPITIESLATADSNRLVSGLLEEGVVDAEVQAYVTRATEGNPLFCEHLVAMLVEQGVLMIEDGRWTARAELSDVTVPLSVHALLAARLDRLPEDERSVIGRAAVVGQVFPVGAIETLVPDSLRRPLPSLLAALERKELIGRTVSDLGVEEAFGFRHLLVRDVAYESVTKADRADFHEQVADWLEETAGDRTSEYGEIIAHHVEQAHRHRVDLRRLDDRARALGDRAATLFADAAARAWHDREDASAAVRLYTRARGLLADDDSRRPVLLANLGWALVMCARYPEAQDLIEEAVVAADRAGDERAAALAAISRLRLRISIDPLVDYHALETEASRAAQVLESVGDDLAAARAWRLAIYGPFTRGEMTRTQMLLKKALDRAVRVGDPLQAVDRAKLVMPLVWGPTPASEVVRVAEETLAEVRGHPSAEAITLSRLAYAHEMLGNEDLADELLEQARARLRELGQDKTLGNVGRLHLLAVRRGWAAAEPDLRAYYEAIAGRRDTNFIASVAAFLARALVELGRAEEAKRLTHVSEDASAADDVEAQIHWRGARALVLAGAGRIAEGESLVREAFAIGERTDRPDLRAQVQVDLFEVLRLDGRLEEARAASEEALRLYREKEIRPLAARVEKALAELATRVRRGSGVSAASD